MVISFFNCFGKVVEKLLAEKLSQFCDANGQLYKGQIRRKKHQSAIDTAALIIHKVQKI